MIPWGIIRGRFIYSIRGIVRGIIRGIIRGVIRRNIRARLILLTQMTYFGGVKARVRARVSVRFAFCILGSTEIS